ncbi:MAG: hypothetical protein V4510_00405 [bacterium]
MKVVLVLIVLCGGLLVIPPAALADCHLPAPSRCAPAPGVPERGCPTTFGGLVAECPDQALGQQDAVVLTVDGLRVEGLASPTVLVSDTDGPHDYPIGSIVTLTFSARWLGNATHPDAVAAVYHFDAHAINWTSAPAGPADVQGYPRYPSYGFTFDDWSGGNTTFQWTFRIPEGTPLGTLHVPVAFAVTAGGRERSSQSDLVLHVVSKEVSVIPPPPFWRDPAFILLVGCVIGLTLGFILFGKPRASASWRLA